MSFSTELAALGQELDQDLARAETVLDSDIQTLLGAVRPLLTALPLAEAAILAGVVKDNLAGLLSNPGLGFTDLFNELMGKELVYFMSLAGQLQNAIVTAFAAAAVAGAQAGQTKESALVSSQVQPPASPPSEPGTV